MIKINSDVMEEFSELSYLGANIDMISTCIDDIFNKCYDTIENTDLEDMFVDVEEKLNDISDFLLKRIKEIFEENEE